MNKDKYDSQSLSEKRAFVRSLIRGRDITSVTSSEATKMEEHELDTLVHDFLEGRTETKAERLKREYLEALEEEEAMRAKSSGADMDEVRQAIDKAIATVNNRVTDIEETLTEALKSPKVVKRVVATSEAKEDNPILAKCLKYYKAGDENETKLMLLSPPSFGKSHAVRKLGKTYDLFLEHGCSRAIDEIDSLIGCPSPDSEKSGFITPDGKLAHAVRSASAGQTVLLFLDEVLRWAENTQAFLLTFLTGVKTEDGLYYSLDTKKTESGKFERISCPAKNLHIICGANLTAEAPISAFWSRFRKHRIEFTNDLAKSITASILKDYGFEAGRKMSYFYEAFADAMEATRDLVKKGALFQPWDFRNLEDGIRASGTDYQELINEVVSLTPDHCTLYDMDQGDTIKDSMTTHQEVTNKFRKHAERGLK
jgi:hypothetical protein